MTQKVRPAQKEDTTLLKHFIGQAGLKVTGIDENVDNYLLMEDENGSVLAIVGLEQYGSDGLLRSLVFSKEAGQDLLLVFFQGILESAKLKQIETLFLFTQNENAAAFFEVFGFQVAKEIPVHIEETEHYQQSVKKLDPIPMICSVA